MMFEFVMEVCLAIGLFQCPDLPSTTGVPSTTTTTTAINTTTALPTKEWTFPRIHIDALFGTTTTDMPAVLNKTIEDVDENEKMEDKKPTEGPNNSEGVDETEKLGDEKPTEGPNDPEVVDETEKLGDEKPAEEPNDAECITV